MGAKSIRFKALIYDTGFVGNEFRSIILIVLEIYRICRKQEQLIFSFFYYNTKTSILIFPTDIKMAAISVKTRL